MNPKSILIPVSLCLTLAGLGSAAVAQSGSGMEDATIKYDEAAEAEAKAAEAEAEAAVARDKEKAKQAAELEAEEVSGDMQSD